MCKHCSYAATIRAMVGRRTVLKLAATATAGLGFLPHALAQIVKAPPKPENVLSPDAALDRLMKGNARYVEGVSKRQTSTMNANPCVQGRIPSPAPSVARTLASRPNIALTRRAATFSSAASRAISPAMKLSQASNMPCRCSTLRSSWCSATTPAARSMRR